MQTRSLVFSALAATSLGASSNSSEPDICNTSLNVTGQADLDKVAGCQKFNGDITIQSAGANLIFNGIQELDGSLTAVNLTDLASISAPQLTSISDDLELAILQSLSTLSMPALTKVGSISFRTLPALREMQFNKGVQEASNVLITDTQLNSLDGLNLSQVDNFNINNNRFISDITVGVTSVTNLLDISFNAAKVNVSLPNLEWANNATFQFCSSVDLPSLKKVNLSMGFINNTIYGINLPQLTEIGQSFAIVSNSKLSNTSAPQLGRIGGGFQIANNTNLKAIVGFGNLSFVGGAIDFVGNFTKAELPNIEDVEGGVVVDSSGQIDCDSFDSAHSKGDFHGDKYVCKGLSTTASFSMTGKATGTGDSSSGSGSATATGSASDSGSSSKSSSSKSSKSKNGVEKVAVPGMLSAIALAIFSLF
ncbi:Cell wall protein ECM33 [Wickerhamiella sorbophila]|uniref:Cell wall protein ECM33 n=1 Tax=Wickerhamiella sorbophila TaxID=45607 RepID=A0A2T0FPR6_9ASCO|nr:Cell wall protein ECM33 [Wickerhamiella sorbophila]PRT56986.1 Cell wall protein ECM33 [Wickerhamiella sorbophila]